MVTTYTAPMLVISENDKLATCVMSMARVSFLLAIPTVGTAKSAIRIPTVVSTDTAKILNFCVS